MKIKNVITVMDLASDKELSFVGISPEEAVIAAYAQSIGDNNTWDYDKYKVVKGRWSVAMGNFCALNNE